MYFFVCHLFCNKQIHIWRNIQTFRQFFFSCKTYILSNIVAFTVFSFFTELAEFTACLLKSIQPSKVFNLTIFQYFFRHYISMLNEQMICSKFYEKDDDWWSFEVLKFLSFELSFKRINGSRKTGDQQFQRRFSPTVFS